MKKVFISQRLDNVGKFDEKRNNLDIRFLKLFEKLNIIPILIPNDIYLTKKIIKDIKPKGIILTSGGDALKKDQSVAAYQGRSQCLKEIDDAREESMKATISQIYFGEEFKVDRKNLVGTDNEGIKYQCELNDVSAKYAL